MGENVRKLDYLIKIKEQFQSPQKIVEYLDLVYQSCKLNRPEVHHFRLVIELIFEYLKKNPYSRKPLQIIDNICELLIENTTNLKQISKLAEALTENIGSRDMISLEISFYSMFNKISHICYQKLEKVNVDLVGNNFKDLKRLVSILDVLSQAELLSYSFDNLKMTIQIHLKDLFKHIEIQKPEMFSNQKLVKITERLKKLIPNDSSLSFYYTLILDQPNKSKRPLSVRMSILKDFEKLTSTEIFENKEIFIKTYLLKKSAGNFKYYLKSVENEIQMNNLISKQLTKHPEVSILTMIKHEIKETSETLEIKLLFNKKPRDLSSLVQQIQNGSALNNNTLHEIFHKLLSALEFLHTLDIIHRDLKPENILVGRNDSEVFIIDFGISLDKGHFEKFPEIKGTASFMAPEVIKMLEGGKLNQLCLEDYKKADIFSLGLVLAKLIKVGNKCLGPECNRPENFHEIQEYLADIKEPVFVKSVLTEMLKMDPNERKSVQDIFSNYLTVATKTFTLDKIIFIEELNEKIEIFSDFQFEDLNLKDLLIKLKSLQGNELMYALVLISRKLSDINELDVENFPDPAIFNLKELKFRHRILNLFDSLLSEKVFDIKNPLKNLELWKYFSLSKDDFQATRDTLSINISTYLVSCADSFQQCDFRAKLLLLCEIVEIINEFNCAASVESEIKGFFVNEVKSLIKKDFNSFIDYYQDFNFLIEFKLKIENIEWRDLCFLIQNINPNFQ